MSLVCNNTSLVQLQIITGFLSRCSLWIKGKREKKKKKRPPLLMAWLRIWFRLLREYVPDCPKGLTAIVYCSTRQDLAPICIKVRAERGGRVHRAAAPVLVLGTEKDISCFKKETAWEEKEQSSVWVIDYRNETYLLINFPKIPFIKWQLFKQSKKIWKAGKKERPLREDSPPVKECCEQQLFLFLFIYLGYLLMYVWKWCFDLLNKAE